MSKTNFNTTQIACLDQETDKDILLEQFEMLTKSGTWELNLDTNCLYWSDGVFRMLGYEPKEFEVNFESGVSVIFQEDREAALAHVEEVLTNNIDYNIKKRLVRKDGKVIWVISKASFVLDPKSGHKKLIGVFQNINEFVQTKEKLKIVKRKNRSLIENLDGIFWEADAQTFEFTYISPQIEQITGYTAKEWMSTRDFWQTHIHPLDRDVAIRTCHLETQKLKDHAFDYRFLTKSGKTIWINDRVNVAVKDGKPHKLRGMMMDITAEKEISHALKEEISLNQSLIQQLPSIFFLFDVRGKFLLWNHHLEEVSGYTAEEISEMSPEQFFTSKDNCIFNSHAEQVIVEGQTDIELKLVTKSGKRIPYYFSASKLKYHDKTCIFGTGQDISELVESRKISEQHIQRFKIVTQATSDAIWDYDSDKNNLYWGEGFLTLFGYDPSKIEANFEFLLSLIHPEDRPRIFRLIQTYMDPTSAKSNWLEEYRFLKSDGTYAFVLDKAIFIRNDHGVVKRVVGAMQDISKQKEYEKSLKNLNERLERNVQDLAISNQELQQFAFVASHDLQEPLRMISSFMGLLERKYKHVLDDKAMEYISFATNGARQMQRIILDLLELSRVGKVSENKVNLNVKNLIEELLHYLKKPIKEKKAIIIIEDLPVIHSYATPLFQIFQNLIGNGIKYSKADVPPKITIRGKELQDSWEFSVEDNGIGIDPEYFNKVFVLFQRLHNQNKYDGSGIGLAIVKKAVEFLEGDIKLESEPGIGSRFVFTIKK